MQPTPTDASVLVSVDVPVLLFTAGLAVVVGVAFGMIPALRARRVSLGQALRDGVRNVGLARSGLRMRSALVIGQVALAMILLASSGLMLRSFWSLRHVDPGFNASDVLAVRVSLPAEEYGDWRRVGDFYDRLLGGVRGIPGVTSASAVTFLPLRDGRVYRTWQVEGVVRDPSEIQGAFLSKVIAEDYFETMGIPLLSWRAFERPDRRRVGSPHRGQRRLRRAGVARSGSPGPAVTVRRGRRLVHGRWGGRRRARPELD